MVTGMGEIMIDGVLIYIHGKFSREIKKKKQNSHLDVKKTNTCDEIRRIAPLKQ